MPKNNNSNKKPTKTDLIYSKMNIKSFKTRIYPTKEQEVYFNKAFGIRRWVYNWGLEKYIESWNNNKDSERKVYFSNYDLAKLLNSIKDEEYPWLNEVNGMVRQESLRDLKESVDKYFKSLKEAKTKLEDYNPNKYKPKFRSKKNSKDSFRYHIKDREHLPIRPLSKHYFRMATSKESAGTKDCRNANTIIKSKESLLFLNDTSKYRVCEYTFSRSCGKYYLSISYERTNQRKLNKPDIDSCIGIDMGLKHALTCYDGNDSWYFDIPESLKNKYEKRTERKHKQLSKKLENIKKYNSKVSNENKIDFNKSKHFLKLKLQLDKCYEKENNVKRNFRENYTTWLVQNYHTIKIEEYGFNTKDRKNIARSLSRVGGYTFTERLKSKCKEYGTDLIFIPKFTPTTQTCSCCGHRFLKENKLTLDDRMYKCPNCNNELDRDINAAKNIFFYNTEYSKLNLVTILEQ